MPTVRPGRPWTLQGLGSLVGECAAPRPVHWGAERHTEKTRRGPLPWACRVRGFLVQRGTARVKRGRFCTERSLMRGTAPVGCCCGLTGAVAEAESRSVWGPLRDLGLLSAGCYPAEVPAVSRCCVPLERRRTKWSSAQAPGPRMAMRKKAQQYMAASSPPLLRGRSAWGWCTTK